MTTEILKWEAERQIQEVMTDGVSEDQLQEVLDVIYGKNMFTVIGDEEFKKKLYGLGSDPIV